MACNGMCTLAKGFRNIITPKATACNYLHTSSYIIIHLQNVYKNAKKGRHLQASKDLTNLI